MSIIINGYKVVSIPFIVHYWECRVNLIDVTIKSFQVFWFVRSPTLIVTFDIKNNTSSYEDKDLYPPVVISTLTCRQKVSKVNIYIDDKWNKMKGWIVPSYS